MCVHVCALFELFVGLIKLVNLFFSLLCFQKKKKKSSFQFPFLNKKILKKKVIFFSKKSEFSVRFYYINSKKKLKRVSFFVNKFFFFSRKSCFQNKKFSKKKNVKF